MRKIKILIMILMTLIFTLLLSIMMNNISYAANYTGYTDVNKVFKSTPNSELGKTINLNLSDMKNSDNIYCIENRQSMRKYKTNI